MVYDLIGHASVFSRKVYGETRGSIIARHVELPHVPETSIACVYSADWLVLPRSGLILYPRRSGLRFFPARRVVDLPVQHLKDRVALARHSR